MYSDENNRCEWCVGDELYLKYHDTEWGVPCRDDRKLFEYLTLEGAERQVCRGLQFFAREHYRTVFDGFNPEKNCHL